MSNYNKLIILIQIDLIQNTSKISDYIIYVNVSSYYIKFITNYESVKFLSTLDNSNIQYNNNILDLFKTLLNYNFNNNILDGYYLCFISNYENIDDYKQIITNQQLLDDEIILLINIIKYVKGFFTSNILKNIYQISTEYKEYINGNIRYKLYKLINYPDPILNINNQTLIYSLKHYIETIILTLNIQSNIFKDYNNTKTYKIGNPSN